MSVNFQHDIILGTMEGPRNQNAASLRPMLHEASLEEQGPSCHNEKKKSDNSFLGMYALALKTQMKRFFSK